jgi:protein gp37
MSISKIEWTEVTWNPVTGCSKISAGCNHCYAERMALRLKAMGQTNYRNGFEVTCHEKMLDHPLHWKKPRTVFVNSMSDLFHEAVPDAFILRIFTIMEQAHWHQFQVLTKRAERLSAMAGMLPWPDNVWMGVTVENSACRHRIDLLRSVPAVIKFLSMEPLLSPVPAMNLTDIDWIIVGGESGPGARPMLKHWVEDIKRQCTLNHIPFFLKQWGGTNKKAAGRSLDGRTYSEMPSAATV